MLKIDEEILIFWLNEILIKKKNFSSKISQNILEIKTISIQKNVN